MDLKKEKQLLKQAQENKEEFAHIYNYFVKDVYRFAYSLTKNHQDAEDVTSQTFKQFLEKINEFTWQEKSLKSWLFITTKNIAYASNRKLTRQTYIEDVDAVVDEQEISFVDEIISKDLSQKIKEEVLLLHPYEQQVITLRIWDGLDFKAIAEIQNISEDAAKKRFYRAINKLQIKLNKEKKFYGIVPFPILFTGLKVAGESFISFPSSLSFSSFLLSTTQAKASMIQLLTSKALLGGTIVATVVATGTGVYFVTKDDKKAEEEKVAEVKSTATPSPTQIITVSPTGTPLVVPTPATKLYTDPEALIAFDLPSGFKVETKTEKNKTPLENFEYIESKTYTISKSSDTKMIIQFYTGGVGCTIDTTEKPFKVDALFQNKFTGENISRSSSENGPFYRMYTSDINGQGIHGCPFFTFTEKSYPQFLNSTGILVINIETKNKNQNFSEFDEIVKSIQRITPPQGELKEYIDKDIRLSFKYDSNFTVEAGKFTPYTGYEPGDTLASKVITISNKNGSKLILDFSNGPYDYHSYGNITVDSLFKNPNYTPYIGRFINEKNKVAYGKYSSSINGQGNISTDRMSYTDKTDGYPEFGDFPGSIGITIETTDNFLDYNKFDDIVKSIKRL